MVTSEKLTFYWSFVKMSQVEVDDVDSDKDEDDYMNLAGFCWILIVLRSVL